MNTAYVEAHWSDTHGEIRRLICDVEGGWPILCRQPDAIRRWWVAVQKTHRKQCRLREPEILLEGHLRDVNEPDSSFQFYTVVDIASGCNGRRPLLQIRTRPGLLRPPGLYALVALRPTSLLSLRKLKKRWPRKAVLPYAWESSTISGGMAFYGSRLWHKAIRIPWAEERKRRREYKKCMDIRAHVGWEIDSQ